METEIDVDCAKVSKRLKEFTRTDTHAGIDIVLRFKQRKEALDIPKDIPAYVDPRYTFNKMLCHEYKKTLSDGREGMHYRDVVAITKKTLFNMVTGDGCFASVKWDLVTSSQGENSWWRKGYELVGKTKFLNKCDFNAKIFNEKYDEDNGESDEETQEQGKPSKPELPYMMGKRGPLTFKNVVEALVNNHELQSYTDTISTPQIDQDLGRKLNLYVPPRWQETDSIDIRKETGYGTIWQMILHLCGDDEKEALHLLACVADMVQKP